MCNNFGYSGKKYANPFAIKLLAIYGRRRGKDGFGIVCDKKLFKYCGYNTQLQADESDSFEVVYGKTISKESLSNIIVGHNRARSKGTITKANTHPFLYNSIEGKTWYFTHNGTISNIDELAKQYNVANEVGEVDSKVFGEILYKYGFNVLSEYEGFAAFSIYSVEEDALYVWKGFSQCDSATPTVERPLFYWQGKRKDKLYYASDYLSLMTALNVEDNICEFDDNCINKVVAGNIIEKTYYDRSHIKYVNKYYTAYNHHKPAYETYPPTNYSKKNHSKLEKVAKNNVLVKDEPCPQNSRKGKIYFWKGKYWKNGHLLNGIFWINDDMTYNMVEPKHVTLGVASQYDYFLDGFKFKDVHAYNKVIYDKKDVDTMSTMELGTLIDPRTICYKQLNNHVSMYRGTEFITEGKKVIPLYSDREYVVKNGTVESHPIETVETIIENTTDNTDKNTNPYVDMYEQPDLFL